MQQPSNRVMGITVVMILLALYSLRNTSVTMFYDDIEEETSVSLCQVRVQFDVSNTFNDRPLLLLLATLKMHDFQIGQPVWGPSDTLLYLCEHQLKAGLKQSIIDKELNNVIRNNGVSTKHLSWSCA